MLESDQCYGENIAKKQVAHVKGLGASFHFKQNGQIKVILSRAGDGE